MSNAEILLQEFQVKADHIVEMCVLRHKESNSNKNGLEPNEFNEIYKEFRAELAEEGTNTIHQSIMLGINDPLLLNGVRGINLSSDQKFLGAIKN